MYEWITHTWNTVKGACPHGCSYCYMKRWGKQNPVRFDEKEIKTDLGEDNFIFVGSSCDMFADDIPKDWIAKTLIKTWKYDKNKYLFQTKNPANVDLGYLPENSFLCTTIETNRWYPDIMQNSPKPLLRAEAMEYTVGIGKYLTIEPIMDFDLLGLLDLIKRCNPIQINIGADSGGHNLPEPSKEKVLELIEELKFYNAKVKIKKNLNRIIK